MSNMYNTLFFDDPDKALDEVYENSMKPVEDWSGYKDEVEEDEDDFGAEPRKDRGVL